MNEPAVIYARVSPTNKNDTDEELSKSIKNQIQKCEEQIIIDKRVLVDTYIDQYVSGKEEKWMEEFKRMKQDSISGKFKWVYCLRFDRLGRSEQDSMNLRENFRKSRVKIYRRDFLIDGIKKDIDVEEKLPFPIFVYSVEEHVSSEFSDGKMMSSFFSIVAERNRERIIENTERGRRELKKKVEDAKKKGIKGIDMEKKFGRKYLPIDWYSVKAMIAEGKNFSQIASHLRIYGNEKLRKITAATLLRRYREEIGEPPKNRI